MQLNGVDATLLAKHLLSTPEERCQCWPDWVLTRVRTMEGNLLGKLQSWAPSVR